MVVVLTDHRNFKFYVDYVPYEDEFLLAIDDNQRGARPYQIIHFGKGMIPVLYAKDVYQRYQMYKTYAQPISNASKLYETGE